MMGTRGPKTGFPELEAEIRELLQRYPRLLCSTARRVLGARKYGAGFLTDAGFRKHWDRAITTNTNGKR